MMRAKLRGLFAVAILAAGLASQPAVAQLSRLPKVSLASLIAQGFEIKAATGNQVGVVGTLILQKDKEVFMCASKDLSIEPTAFECWAVK